MNVITAPTASNSVQIHPQNIQQNLTTEPLAIGIDKLAFTFPVLSFRRDTALWDECWNNGAKLFDYLNVNASLTVNIRKIGNTLRCSVEFNPSRLLDPFGHSLCRPEEVLSTISMVLQQLQPRLDVSVGMDEMKVTRLDVARDFQVSDPQFFLTGLRYLPRSYSRSPCTYDNAVSGAAETLRLSTSKSQGARKPNHVSLYDKGIQTGLPELSGVLRWEVQGRTWPKSYGGIESLADLTRTRLEAFAWDRWAWSRMGEAVEGKDQFLDRLYATEDMEPAVRIKLVGQCVSLQAGKPAFQNIKGREKFDKQIRQLGVSLSAQPGEAAHLDFATGKATPFDGKFLPLRDVRQTPIRPKRRTAE